MIMKIRFWCSVYKRLWHAISHQYRLAKVQSAWREKNRHNHTIPENYPFPMDRVEVGNNTYGPLHVSLFSENKDEYLRIGSYCSIAENVNFLLGGEHSLDRLTTYPLQGILEQRGHIDSYSKGPIIVEDDVWIGHGAIILSGVRLRRGSVVAAGSVVTKDTEPYSIVGGCPARLIRKRVPEDVVPRLENIDISRLNREMLQEHSFISQKRVEDYSQEEWNALM